MNQLHLPAYQDRSMSNGGMPNRIHHVWHRELEIDSFLTNIVTYLVTVTKESPQRCKLVPHH